MGDMAEIYVGHKELHRQRVAKTPECIAYAIQEFEKHGISYELKNQETGHFHSYNKKNGKLYQFYAGTGKIMGFNNLRGIKAYINLCEG